MRNLNVLNLALTDQGGAGIAARSFTEMLVRAGHRAVLVVKESQLADGHVVVLRRPSAVAALATRILNRVSRALRQPEPRHFDGKYSFYDTGAIANPVSVAAILAATPFKPDVIILHWVSGFVTPQMAEELAAETRARMLWLMMDNAPITGGCHYPWECEGYLSDCSSCPAILTETRAALASRTLALKRQHLPRDMGVLACSESDFRRARQSSLFASRPVHKLLIPVDRDQYSPGDRDAARRRFGVDPDGQVIFYGSILLTDRRKGGQLFLEALRRLQDMRARNPKDHRSLTVLVAGRADLGLFEGVGFPVKATGFLNEGDLADAYRCADVFVSSSLEDSGPLMINQSIMCGTPVVSFDIGVAQDLVRNDTTGYRARAGDVDDLATGIARVLDLPEARYRTMRERCRALGLELCDPDIQMRKLGYILDGA